MELDIKYFDLGITHRDATDDKVTAESAEATLKYVDPSDLIFFGLNGALLLCYQLSMCSKSAGTMWRSSVQQSLQVRRG